MPISSVSTAARPLTVRAAIAASLLGGSLSILAVWTAIGFRPSGPIDPVNPAIAFCIGPLLALYLGLRRHAPDQPTRRALGLERPRALALAAAIAGGVALAIVVRCLKVVLLRHLPPFTAPPLPRDVTVRTPGSGGQILLVAAEVAVLFEITLLEQGFVLRGLRAAGGPARRTRIVSAPLVTLLAIGWFFLLPRDEPLTSWMAEATMLCVALTAFTIAARSTWPALVLEAIYLAAYLALDLELVRLPGFTDDLASSAVRGSVLVPGGLLLLVAFTAIALPAARSADTR